MKKIALLITLLATLAFANETKMQADTVIQHPSKEQLAMATPLNNTICPITLEKIGSMGMAVPVIYGDKIVNLCCKGCPADFAKNPEKYMKIVNHELASNPKPSEGAKPKNEHEKMPGMDHSKMH